MSEFLDLFSKEKPMIGMIHLKGKDALERLAIAKEEIDLLTELGIDGILVENYHGNTSDVTETLKYLHNFRKNLIYGVNILGDYKLAFSLASAFNAKFIQIDSVSGHLSPDKDNKYGTELNQLRHERKIPVIGGVRFKYQPINSGRSLKTDLEFGMARCNGIVVTGSGTAMETDIEKIREFRRIIGNFPLILGAGITAENCLESMKICDAGIVGSYIKTDGDTEGDIEAEKVKKLLNVINGIRK